MSIASRTTHASETVLTRAVCASVPRPAHPTRPGVGSQTTPTRVADRRLVSSDRLRLAHGRAACTLARRLPAHRAPPKDPLIGARRVSATDLRALPPLGLDAEFERGIRAARVKPIPS